MRKRGGRVVGSLLSAGVFVASCAASAPPPSTSFSTVSAAPIPRSSRAFRAPPRASAVRGRGTAVEPYLLCMRAPRTDYPFVGAYTCADGTVPLGGDPMRGAQARRGNVGSGPDGHMVDLYDVPCPSGPVEVYVDGYHCGGSPAPSIDPNNLSREQLANMARNVRAFHENPTENRALTLRPTMLDWLSRTPQVGVVVCPGVVPWIPQQSAAPVSYTMEFALSLGAAIIEDGREQADPVLVYVRALRGLLAYYRAVVRERGTGAVVASLELLASHERNGALEREVRGALNGCDTRRLGLHAPSNP